MLMCANEARTHDLVFAIDHLDVGTSWQLNVWRDLLDELLFYQQVALDRNDMIVRVVGKDGTATKENPSHYVQFKKALGRGTRLLFAMKGYFYRVNGILWVPVPSLSRSITQSKAEQLRCIFALGRND
jgi:hypothetical protein